METLECQKTKPVSGLKRRCLLHWSSYFTSLFLAFERKTESFSENTLHPPPQVISRNPLTTILVPRGMNQSMRQRLTVLLLVTYVPIALLVGWLHTDEVTPTGNGNVAIQPLVVKGTARTAHGDCLACTFAASHLVESGTRIFSSPFSQAPVSCFVPPTLQTTPQSQSARAPPVPSSS
jgi:hypothetical protein